MTKLARVAIIDSDPLRRNRLARFLYEKSHPVEPYESSEELRKFWPAADIVLLHDDEHAPGVLFELMIEHGCWLPVMTYADEPKPSRIVDVILMGAVDYLPWPITEVHWRDRLEVLSKREESFAELRRRTSRSKRLIEALSQREREVLFRLARGASNKGIARELQISPRTIEIHRANLMGKLGVQHLGEAISLALYSTLNSVPKNGAVDPI